MPSSAWSTINVKVRVKSDGSGVDIANVKMSMNPFDEIAVEEAVRLKEAGVATEIIAVSCGVSQCQETLRTALAIGADRAILVETDAELQPLAVAKLLKALVDKEAPRSSSWASRRSTTTATRPARCWRRCSTGRRRRLPRRSRSPTARPTVTREVDGGLETLSIELPAVITTDLRLNEPRYVTLPNIMKAKKKPLETLSSPRTWAWTSRRASRHCQGARAAEAQGRHQGGGRRAAGRQAEERSEGDLK